MDWNKVLQSLWEAGRRVFTFAGVVILILFSFSAIYMVAAGLWWLVKRVHAAVGT